MWGDELQNERREDPRAAHALVTCPAQDACLGSEGINQYVLVYMFSMTVIRRYSTLCDQPDSITTEARLTSKISLARRAIGMVRLFIYSVGLAIYSYVQGRLLHVNLSMIQGVAGI